jgi:hypothetical protein
MSILKLFNLNLQFIALNQLVLMTFFFFYQFNLQTRKILNKLHNLFI